MSTLGGCLCRQGLSQRSLTARPARRVGLKRIAATQARSSKFTRGYASLAPTTQINQGEYASKSPSSSSSTIALPARVATKQLLKDLRTLLLDSVGRHGGINDKSTTQRRQVSFGANSSEQEQAWLERLSGTLERLGQSTSASASVTMQRRKTRIAVVARDERQAREFTLALLDDPLASEQTGYRYLRERVNKGGLSLKGKTKETVVRHASNLLEMQGQVDVPSAWLNENAVELLELVHADPSTPLSTGTWTSLHASDIVICLSPPQDRGDVSRLTRKDNVLFASPEPPGPSTPSSHPDLSLFLSSAVSPTISRVLAPPLSVSSSQAQNIPRIILNPSLANEANSLLRKNGTSDSGGGSDFSSLLLTSGFPQLRQYIDELLSSDSSDIHLDTAQSTLQALILDLSSSLVRGRLFLNEAKQQLAILELRTAREKMHTRIELAFTDLGNLDLEKLVDDTPRYAPRVLEHDKKVDAEEEGEENVLLEDGKRDVQLALEGNRLKWWKLPLGRADDIAPALSTASGSYFAGLERKLIFETGRLSARTVDLSKEIDGLFKSPGPFRASSNPDELSLYSSLTHNALLQRSPSTAYGFPIGNSATSTLNNVVQTSLSQPISQRRQQLIAPGGVIESLQLRAQKAVLQFYGISGGSIALGIFGSQAYLQSLEAAYLSTQSGIGLAIFGSVLAAWRLQGRWQRAIKLFWRDWKRSQEGLSFDLQTNADHVLEEKVFQKANYAKRTLKAQLEERIKGLDVIEKQLRSAQAKLSEMRDK